MMDGLIRDAYTGLAVQHRDLGYLVGTITRTRRLPASPGGRVLSWEIRWTDGEITEEDCPDVKVMQ